MSKKELPIDYSKIDLSCLNRLQSLLSYAVDRYKTWKGIAGDIVRVKYHASESYPQGNCTPRVSNGVEEYEIENPKDSSEEEKLASLLFVIGLGTGCEADIEYITKDKSRNISFTHRKDKTGELQESLEQLVS